KRIATSGSVTIQMAAGIYGPGVGAQPTISTYHADADRITLQGTMQGGQQPPTTGNFQRSGSDAASRANDSAFNIQMLRARYATEIKMALGQFGGLLHSGPGQITYKNLLVTGPNVLTQGQRGLSLVGPTIYSASCSVWGSSDVGIGAATGHIETFNCHVCSCGT